MRIVVLIFAVLFAGSAAAQTYPSRPIRLVVPNAPGGPTDIAARLMAQRMTESMGQPVIVENRPGAGGSVGTETVARAAPDGYTILITASGPMVVTPHLNSKLPYDAFRDFAPVSRIATLTMVLISNINLPVKSVQELVALAKANPGKLNYSTGGVGTAPHLLIELLKATAGIDIVHVPYRGNVMADTAIISGEAAFTFSTPSSLEFAKAGSVRALAVSSAKRASFAPDIPTLIEAGFPGMESIAWYGAFVPTGTPEPIIDRLNAEITKAMRNKTIDDRMQTLGFDPFSPQERGEFSAYMRAESNKWQKVIRDAGIKVE